MAPKRHFKRRKQKQACRSFVMWSCAVVIAMLGMAGWRGASGDAGTRLPAYVMNPDASDQPAPATPRVHGDGVLDTPSVTMKLVPTLTAEVAGAVKSGDAGEALRHFTHWIVSGEALRSEVFWLFWSIMGAGIIAVACCSLVTHFMEWRHRVSMSIAGGPDRTVSPDDSEGGQNTRP